MSMKLYGVFPRNEVAKNKRVLMAEQDDKGNSISEQFKDINKEIVDINNALIAMEKLVVENMTELTSEECEALKCGDIVLKEDETGQHAYLVSFKKNKVGMCITYTDASVVETVSYDYDNVEESWVYNSTDITPLIETQNNNEESEEVNNE